VSQATRTSETKITQDGALSSFGLREHLTTIFRHKRKLFTIVVVAAIVAGIGSFLMPGIYKAEVRLLMQSSRASFPMNTSLTGQVLIPPEIIQKDDVATEVQIFTSPVMLEKLVDELGVERVLAGMRSRWDVLAAFQSRFGRSASPEDLRYQAVQELRSALNVEGVRQTHVFIATLDSPDPNFAAEALNALVDIYLDHQLIIRKGKSSREFFDEQTSEMRLDLSETELRLQTFKDKWNIVSIEDQKRHLLQQATHTEAALRETQVAVAEADVRIANLKERLAGQQEAIPLTNVSERNPLHDQLKNRLMLMELEYSQYVPDSPAAGDLKREMAAIRAQLQAESVKVTGAATSGVNQTYQDLKKTLVMEEGRRESLRPRLAELGKQVKAYRDSLNTLDQRELGLQGLMREVKVKQEALDLYLKKEEESRLNDKLDRKGVSNVTPIEYAAVPQKPTRPRKLLNLLIGLFMGLIGGVGVSYVAEYMRRSFVTREEVQERLSRPVIASLPVIRPNTSHAGIFNIELRHAAQHIIRSYHERGLRTVLVTSVLHGEGRSRVSDALALVLSEQHFGVLLITAEEARPGKAGTMQGFDALEKEGLMLRHGVRDVLESTDRPQFHRLRISPREQTAMEKAEHLAEVAKAMRDRFDLIVIDGPPSILFPEMRLVIAGVGGTILVVEAERTVALAAARAVAVIEGAGGYLLGVILNKRRYVIPDWIYQRWLASRRREAA
jgi:polysaccharide biosynthesis transport protein